MLSLNDLPTLNALLNGTSAVLLGIGYYYIRKGKTQIHHRIMLTAFSVSVLFLISYVIYHAQAGETHFVGQGFIRPVYFTMLISHIVLAAAIVPLALITLIRALRERFAKHRAIARWTLPIWFYVSVTGVFIYLMLYHFYPAN